MEALRITVIMLTLSSILFLAALDMTIIATIAPTVSEQFASPTGYVWAGSSYLLASAISTPSLARCSDVWGRKPLILVADSLFLLGSLLAATSTSMAMFLVGRAIQGTGGGGIIVLVQIIISDLFSERDRAAYLSVIEVVFAVALAVGPTLGGVITERASWRWVFYMNLPAGGVALILAFFFLDIQTPAFKFLEGVAIIDWTGSLLITVGTGLFLVGLEFGAAAYPWDSPLVICLIVFGVAIAVVFVVWELYYSTNPLMPMKVFTHRSSCATLIVCFMHGLVSMAGSYFLPLYFQSALGASPLSSGVYFLPTTLATSIASILGGLYIRATGNYFFPIFVGLVFMTAGNGMFVDLSATSTLAKIILYQIIAAAGIGLNYQAPLVGLQAMVSPDNVASATATLNFLRNLATAISVIAGGTIFQSQMSNKRDRLHSLLGNEMAARFSGEKAVSSIPAIARLSSTEQIIVQEAYADSLSVMWIFYTALSAVGLVAAVCITQLKLKKEHEQISTGIDAEMRRIDAIRVEREDGKS
ncbi:MFS general substrate transporter [Pseudovirgaria hyperparasitica]|uniref:MFS general substrate transporter n=1 Tax=Pseudovirgaria hyperparasitica TaxID=470096 RepID=A0A6A6WC68_9PEZI|nr:MFS general substrate transporter [Pseudovirgaria hyperparasitica]KAF2760165.1 MFS general substrate transporter [Pseudovirgaria hyperparasitica]